MPSRDIKDAITEQDFPDGTWTLVNKAKARCEGVEAELKTVPFYDFTLRAAAAYSRTKDPDTGEVLMDNPEYTYDVGLQYDDTKSFRALLHGRYIWWNATADATGKYNSFVFDVNVIKTLFRKRSSSGDIFITVHNLFNGPQYFDESYKNASRWVEAGMRLLF
jgi:vitamin B12 transporter